MTQDGQQGLAVTNDTQVTSDMTLKQRVSTDKEANDQDQLLLRKCCALDPTGIMPQLHFLVCYTQM